MTPTFALQHKLPRLPVPSLRETCALYLHSVKPLQTPEEHAKTAKLVADFLASDLAASLQQRLIDIDRASPYNWLEDNFWLKKAYLEWRDPLMVNSNWYILGQDDANHPKELLANNGVRPNGEFTEFQIRRAAHLIRRALEYHEAIVNERIPVDMLKGNQPQCMWQYTRTFAVTRVPLYHCDTIVHFDPSTIRHIVVLVRDQVYKLQVYKEQGEKWILMTMDEIQEELLTVVSHVQNLDKPQPPVPLLSSWDRDNWATARNHLLSIDPRNRETTNTIESALFAVALDDHSLGADSASWTHTGLCGHVGLGNGHNRWFDKSVTFVIESNGKCFMAGEHAPADAFVVSYILDYMVKEPCPGPLSAATLPQKTTGRSSSSKHVSHLPWITDATIHRYIAEAQASADAIAALSDSCVLIFDDYGNDWIKKVGKIPPDAFYQMVLQLAYYRVHKKVTATYETASTRKYLHGRTDTIRTCSVESKQFVEGWSDPSLGPKAKYELLVKAAAAHKRYTQIASDGHGCDRHLMVLRLLNADHQIRSPVTGKLEKAPMHPMFEDPIFRESQTWRLSTSSLHAGIRLMGTGFGAVVPDGYGVNYMPAPTLVKFGIEAKRVPQTIGAQEFGAVIRQVMLDMKSICEQVNNPGTTLEQAKI